MMLSMILIGVFALTVFQPAGKVAAADSAIKVYGRNTLDGNVYQFRLYEKERKDPETGEVEKYYAFAGFFPKTSESSGGYS